MGNCIQSKDTMKAKPATKTVAKTETKPETQPEINLEAKPVTKPVLETTSNKQKEDKAATFAVT